MLPAGPGPHFYPPAADSGHPGRLWAGGEPAVAKTWRLPASGYALGLHLRESDMSSRIRQAEKPYERTDLPVVSVGDSVAVHVKIKEGERERVQVFSGTVIRVRGGGMGRTFTVRRIVQGEGVERTFPIHSPVLEAIEITRKGRVRRSRLYYLRDRVGKGTRLREVLGARGQIASKTKAKPQPVEAPAPEAPAPEAPETADVAE